VSTTTPAIDPAAVLKLPAVQKRAILDALLGDFGAHGVLQLELPNGPERIYRPMPNAHELAEESLRNATPEELAESLRRANDPDSAFMSVEEVKQIGVLAPPPASPAPSAPPVRATAG
jgi:hypothetical protein